MYILFFASRPDLFVAIILEFGVMRLCECVNECQITLFPPPTCSLGDFFTARLLFVQWKSGNDRTFSFHDNSASAY